MSIDERKKMQQAFIDNDDGSWEKEQSEKEKAKAGIVPYEATQSRSVSQANTKAADKWAKTHLGVKKTNYTKQDIKAVNRVNRAMQRLYKEYPQLNGFIDEIRFVDNLGTDAARAAISKKGSEIKTVLKISSSHFADQKVINNLIKSQVEEGNWTPKSGAYGILKHEMVHMVTYKKTISMYDNLDDTWKAIDGDVFCKSIMEDAMSACNLKVDRSIIKQKLGIYAAKRPDEFVAEAVSSTKNTKLEKTVKKLFKERTSE